MGDYNDKSEIRGLIQIEVILTEGNPKKQVVLQEGQSRRRHVKFTSSTAETYFHHRK